MKSHTKIAICPKYGASFSFAENRAYQIHRKYAPWWFFDAIKQFENHNEVKCPSCRHKYTDNDARLFYYFKSPCTVVVLCLLFLVVAIVVLFSLKAAA